MTTIISSQRYVNEQIVAEKIASQDFTVQLSPEFEFEGDIYQVVLDGHHSLAAAKEAGVEPEWDVLTDREHDAITLLDEGQAEEFLNTVWLGNDWYNIMTGYDIW